MLGVGVQQGVQRAGLLRRGAPAGQHPAEVGGVVQFRVGLHRLCTHHVTRHRSHHRGQATHEPRRLGGHGLAGDVVRGGVLDPQQRYGRAQHSHRVGTVERCSRQEGCHGLRQVALRGHQRGESRALGGIGPVAVPQQPGNVTERGLGDEVPDVVAPVGQHAGRPVDGADRGVAGQHAFETGDDLRLAVLTHQ